VGGTSFERAPVRTSTLQVAPAVVSRPPAASGPSGPADPSGGDTSDPPASSEAPPPTVPLPSIPTPIPGGGSDAGGAPVASVTVGGRSGDSAGTVTVTVDDTVEVGAQIGDLIVGTPSTEPPAEDGIEITTGGDLLPPTDLTLP
jgi:hypothetical protein